MLCNSKLGVVNINAGVFAEALQATSTVDIFQQLPKQENEYMLFGKTYRWEKSLGMVSRKYPGLTEVTRVTSTS